MGWKDTEWATTIVLPLVQKSVLIALSIRTDDKSHATYVGQKTIAEMTGASEASVRRALRELEQMGVISRSRRSGAGGYRTSDLTTLNTAYRSESLVGTEPSGQSAYKAESSRLPVTQHTPTDQSDGAEEITQIDHSEDHSDIPADRFDEFYETYPRKAKRPDAQRAWEKAIKTTDPDHIITAATAYRNNPIPDHKKPFIPYPASWLNGKCYNDPLPDWYAGEKPTPTSRALGLLQAGQNLIQARQAGGAQITTLNPLREIS